MSPEERHRMLDDATVWLMEQTSWRSERDFLVDCGWCRNPFWAHTDRARYCCKSHAVLASQARHPEAARACWRRRNERLRAARRAARAA